MLRNSLLAVALFLTACGMEAQVPRRGEEPQPLTHAEPANPQQQPASARLQIEELRPSLVPQQLTPAMDTVSVHSLAAADGTQVRYLLGTMGCGISVVAKGTAMVQGGAFEIQYDSSLSGWGQMSLFFQFADGACDPETSQTYEVAAGLPGSIDLSVLPEASSMGCWMFDTQN